MYAFDLETHRFAPGNMAPKPVSHASSGLGGVGLWLTASPEGVAEFTRALRDEDVLVGQNVAYDMMCWMRAYPLLVPAIFKAYNEDRVTDTEVRQKLLDIASGDFRGYVSIEGTRAKITYNLAAMAKRHLGVDLNKGDVRTGYGDLDGVPLEEWPAEAIHYAKSDPAATLLIAQRQEEIAKETPGVFDDQFRQTRAAMALKLASTWGVQTDGEVLDALSTKTQARIEAHLAELKEAGFVRDNGSRDMKKIYAAIEAADPGHPRTKPTEKRPTGTPKTDSESLATCTDPALVHLSDYGKAVSLLTGSIKDMKAGVETPIHTWFDSIMETGRTSSSGPNLQNIRREPGIRESIIPRPGHVIAACDFDKAELHTLAEVCYQVLGRSALGESLNRGDDPHLRFGAKLLDISYEDAVEFRKDPEVKDARQRAKPVLFGFTGGMGIDGFLAYAQQQYGQTFTKDQATHMRGLWLDTYPEMNDYFKWIRSLLAQASVYTARQLFSNRLRGHCRFTVLCNTFFQGLAADGAKAALWAVAEKEYNLPGNPLYGCRTINFIHDELLVEVPDDPELADAAARELQATMIEAFNHWVPHVPVNAEVALMHRWQKGAEPCYDGDLLVPDPKTKEPIL